MLQASESKRKKQAMQLKIVKVFTEAEACVKARHHEVDVGLGVGLLARLLGFFEATPLLNAQDTVVATLPKLMGEHLPQGTSARLAVVAPAPAFLGHMTCDLLI